MDIEYKCYYTDSNIFGHIGNGIYIRFPTEEEYSEYLKSL